MEQWQFLIQKEGERTWYPLEKPRVEIIEGRYRVVARSSRTNTGVEVRVTHSSTNEVPPRRRIQKRRRRINSEGLTAVIPFTYLKSGIWELQCSGDLMSDLLGASWQYTVSVTVIPSVVEKKIISPTKSSHNLDEQHQVINRDALVNQPNRTQTQVQNFQTNDVGLISSSSIEAIPKQSGNTSRKLTSKISSDNHKEKLRESLKANSAKQKGVGKNTPRKSIQKSLTQQNQAISNKSAEKLRHSAKGTPSQATGMNQKQPEKSREILNKSHSKKPTQKSLEKSQVKSTKAVTEQIAKKPSNKKGISDKPAEKGNLAITEKKINPVRLKGDTAEQILQNLMELALPSSETLLVDEDIDYATTAPPLPLILALDKVNYVASWGTTITIEGLVQPKETTNEQLKKISQAEVIIELRTPQNSQILQSFCQPNPNKSLPFAITSSINIPEECDSKLILGEVKFYGALGEKKAVELLASQSFTITAEIKELLAITVANPKGELEKFADSRDKLSSVQNTPQVLEDTVSLDLELFNLVKTVKSEEQSVTGVASTKKSLPPRIEARKLGRRFAGNSLKLPNVPGYQERINEYINHGYLETASDSAITNTSFPYLRKVEAVPSSKLEFEESTYISVEENQNTAKKSAQPGKTSQAELVVDEQKEENSCEFEEPVNPRNSELLVQENLSKSPLIRQWMLSQGYSVPEPIDVEYEDYDISYQQVSSANTENEKKAQGQTDIQVTPSPYLSISTSSQWQVNPMTAPSAQIAQEIVVDDIDIFADNILTVESSQLDEAIENNIDHPTTTAITISTDKIENLPIPQVYIPPGELISGKSLNIRVRLPEGNSHLAVKLWLEDCQMRHLLDGPHLLTNLTPNKNKELEVITKLNIPFGCLEIRLEAIAINTVTQQESHKFTIQRTVIPPDLPNIQLDAILGM